MMAEVLVEQIVGKVAMSNGGHRFGIIEDIVLDTDTGEMKYLLIRPEERIPGGKVDASGRTVVSFSTLKVSDSFVVFS